MSEMRIFGPPGTGKTTYLSRQIAIAAEKYGGDAIMAASFTKAAAIELISRDLPVNPANVGTLHALCYRALGSPPIADLKTKEFNESQTIYRLSHTSGDLDEPDQSFDTDTDMLFAKYQTYRSQMAPRVLWRNDVIAFAKAWEGWKYETGYIDFTDMIEVALNRQVPPPGDSIIGFFDESQDFTKLELSLIRMWGDYLATIIVVGDDDQCLYSFKGADPDAFLNPPLPDEQVRVLKQSYRLPSAIHRYSDSWIRQLRVRQEKAFAPRESAGQITLRRDLFFSNPDAVVNLLEEFEEIDPDSTTMIIGACSYQIQPVVSVLKKRGMIFHNPYRTKRGDWNPLGHRTGVGTPFRIECLLRWPWSYGDVRAWSELVNRTGVFQRGNFDRIMAGPPATDFLSPTALSELFSWGVVEQLRADPLKWLIEHAPVTKAASIAYPVEIIKKHGIEMLKKRPKIIVGTIHSVKGGEADNVLIFPDLSPAGMRQYASDVERDGIVRQFYVGMTRAKENLILCNQSSPSSIRWPQVTI